MSAIKPIAVFPVEGSPDWQVVTGDAVWVTSAKTNTVHGRPQDEQGRGHGRSRQEAVPGLAAGFGS
jgi:hypothetical protein